MKPPLLEGGANGTQGAAAPSRSGLDRIFRTTLVIVPIGVLGNLAFSYWTTDAGFLASVAALPRGYLALAVGLGLLPWLTNATRLFIWARFLGQRLAFREAFQMTLAVDLGSAISPTAVGGTFFKWGMLVQRGMSPGAAASLTTLPMIEDALFFAIALPTAVFLTASWDLPIFRTLAEEAGENLLPLALIAGAIALLSWVAARSVLVGGLGSRTRSRSVKLLARTRRRLRTYWRDAREVFSLIRRGGKWRFAVSFTLTGIQWISRYSVITALIAFLGAPVQPVLFWLLQWVVFTLMTFIPTPGAAGGAEAAFFFIYSPFVPSGVIGLTTAGWRFLTFYLQLGLASVLFFIVSRLVPRVRAAQTG